MCLVSLASLLTVACSSVSGTSSVPVSVSGGTASTTETSSAESSFSSQDLSGADLTYVNWNVGTADENNLERQMVAAFNEKFNKHVTIVENVNKDQYEAAITAMAAKGQMPDVFMLTNTTFGLSNKYLADMTSYTSADADWATIPTSVSEPVKYKGKIYAIPFALHMRGYFENEALLDENNLASLSVAPTWDDFYNVISSLKEPSKHMGLNNETTLFEWYPAQINKDYGWFSFDGSQYHLDSADFATAMNLTRSLRTNKMTFDSLTADERTTLGYTSDVDLWNDGKLGLRYGYTYEIPDMLAHSTFDKKFIGVPGGRTPFIPDYLAVSPTCKDPQLAYNFAKWMSFSADGIKKRLELDSDGTLFSSLPLSTSADVISAYFDAKYNRMPGLEEAYRNSTNAIVEGVKVIPGFVKSRWQARVGKSVTIKVDGQDVVNPQIGQVIDQCWLGNLSWADYATSLNSIANAAYTTALASFSDNYAAFDPHRVI